MRLYNRSNLHGYQEQALQRVLVQPFLRPLLADGFRQDSLFP